MKILIYSAFPESPHLETDLELACKFKDEGHEITIVRCTGQLKSCLVNPEHSAIICSYCKSKYKNALDLSGLSGTPIISLEIEAHENEAIPRSFENVESLRDFKFRGANLGFSVASTLIGRFEDHRFDTVKHQKEVYKELQMSIGLYLSLERILSEVKPDVVYLFNGRFSTHNPLQCLCIQNKIAFYTHERAGVINKYILRENNMPHDIEYSLRELHELWKAGGDDKEQIGTKFFTDRKKGVIQSWMPFTGSQKKGSLPQGFDQNKKNIAIYGGTMAEYEGMEVWSSPFYKNDNDGIRRILESFKEELDFVFYLRVHPSLKFRENTQTREIHEIAKQYQNVHLIRAEDPIDSYQLMDSAYKVLTFGSTMGVEATFWNKPSVLVGKSFYMSIDACYEPSTHEEMVELIKKEDLKPKPQINAIKYGYWDLTRGEPYKRFKQIGLFKMTCNGKVSAANPLLAGMEKLVKLGRIRNKRNWHDFKGKIKDLIK